MTNDEKVVGLYWPGDAEVVLIGLAAALAARWHARRKGYRQIESDAAAIELLGEGIELAESIPLDDVSDVRVAIDADSATLRRLKEMAPDEWTLRRRLEDEDDDAEGGGHE